MMKWNILIATIEERKAKFENLRYEFLNQIIRLNLTNEVGVIFKSDNKEMSIGAKRQWLLDQSKARYINYFDDDDFPYPNYVENIYNAIKDGKVDCVGMVINMTTNLSRPQKCCHSLRYKVWENGPKDGYDFLRNVTHFNPVKRKIAVQVGFPDKRWGEDQPYSDGVTSLCKTEAFIEEPLFHYRYSNQVPHNVKYGIK